MHTHVAVCYIVGMNRYMDAHATGYDHMCASMGHDIGMQTHGFLQWHVSPADRNNHLIAN